MFLSVAGTVMVSAAALTLVPSTVPTSRATAAVSLPQPARTVGDAADPAPQAVHDDPGVERFTGMVGANLTQSLEAAGVPSRQGREYVALLARAIKLADGLSVDDRFDLIVEHENGKFGQLLFAGLDRVARADVQLLKWTDGKQVIWVNADGVGGQDSSSPRLPVAGRVTSQFGERFHPILGYRRMHDGVDLAAAAGTPIVAAADGRVASAGWAGGYGQQVRIAHNDGVETRYGHMSRIAAYAGELVHRGDVIGYVGSTGLSTGPHLHFEVTRNGRPVNPLTAKFISGPAQLQGAKLVQFHNELRQLLLAGG